MAELLKRIAYLVLFICTFALACYLLASPLVGRFFYPLHYQEYISAYAAEYRVDPLLVAAVIYTESGFRQDAVSARGARGLMQIMPATAGWVAGKIGYDEFSPEMLFEPRCNIQIGTWYLADLLQQFHGSEAVALAAYNGGRSEVRRWLEQGIWDGSAERLEQVPFSETRTFVRRALKTYARYYEIYGNREESHGYSYLNQGRRSRA